MDVQWANFWVNFALALITFLAVVIALFGKAFWDWWNKPKMIFRLGNKEPHRIQGITNNKQIIWYFRLEVMNVGKTIAKNCYIKINSVLSDDGRQIEYFEPSKLKWSGAPRDMNYRENPPKNINEVDIPNLPPIFRESKDISPRRGWELCDLFETLGDGSFTFLSHSGRPYYRINEGNYIIEIEIFGDDIEPKKKKFKLSYIRDFPLIRIDWV